MERTLGQDSNQGHIRWVLHLRCLCKEEQSSGLLRGKAKKCLPDESCLPLRFKGKDTTNVTAISRTSMRVFILTVCESCVRLDKLGLKLSSRVPPPLCPWGVYESPRFLVFAWLWTVLWCTPTSKPANA
jgi:hypothetical protein